MRKFTLTAISATFLLTLGMTAIAQPVSKEQYKTSKTEIFTQYKADKTACSAFSGNAKDICVEEARGREKIAKAELESNYSPSEKSNYQLRLARADSAYAKRSW